MEQLTNPDKEINERKTMGILVRLMLRSPDELYITYEHGNDFFMADVTHEKALHAFNHPNLYRPDGNS